MAFGLCDLHTELEIYIFMCMYYKMFMRNENHFIGFTMLSGKTNDYIGTCFLFFRVRSL